jgi:hypothetical protein
MTDLAHLKGTALDRLDHTEMGIYHRRAKESSRQEPRMAMVNGGTALASGLALSDLNLAQLWDRYLWLTGTQTLQELHAYLDGLTQWSTSEHNIAAQALNEYFTDRGLGPLVAYADEV